MPDRTEIRKRWDDMQHRVRGKVRDGCGNARWQGLEVGWSSFHEFREWAFTHGWLPGLSLDRIDGSKGYTPGNCQWITKQANDRKARNSHASSCQCFWCKRRPLPSYEPLEGEAPF
jgi:hypothetical protein